MQKQQPLFTLKTHFFQRLSHISSINFFEGCCIACVAVCCLACKTAGAHGLVCEISIAHNVSSRRETAVPAFSPPDSPLSRLPIAHKLFWSFFLITAPAFSRLHRLNSRLTARLPAARAEFLQRVRRLLTGGSLCSAVVLRTMAGQASLCAPCHGVMQ